MFWNWVKWFARRGAVTLPPACGRPRVAEVAGLAIVGQVQGVARVGQTSGVASVESCHC